MRHTSKNETIATETDPRWLARKAKPCNVKFPTGNTDAEAAGFRHCRRGKPDKPALHEQHAVKVFQICRLIECTETEAYLPEMAKQNELGIYHSYRDIKAPTRLIANVCAAMRRARRMRKYLKYSPLVIKAISGSGDNSNSHFCERA